MFSQTSVDARLSDAWGIMGTSAQIVDARHADPLAIEPRTATAQWPMPGPADMKLVLQPVHALVGGALLGAEATLPAARPLMPGGQGHQSTAEEMSAALLQCACREAQAWPTGPERRLGVAGGLRVSVCVPAAVIGSRALLAQTRLALEQSDLPPELLEVTIMEHAMGNDAPEMLLAVSALRDMGAGVVLDQFTGGSHGLRMLRRLPFTSIWLAPALTAELAYQREARAAAAAVITFAHALDAIVVARDVATPVQQAILADLGCDGGQGPIFGAAMEASIFRHALTGWLDN
jgi:EAL domain-containing protein (putative c-di-GMP-specific phosphodiesterase class I)